jgi:uncharacterized membrane protein
MSEETMHETTQESSQPYQKVAPNSPLAMASLVLSILGLVGVLPLLGSIIGLILGYMARNDIESSGGTLGGSDLAKWGIILGWIGIGIGLLICCFVAFILVIALSAAEYSMLPLALGVGLI